MSYPYFSQYDSRDCGPACLRMIAKYYGKSFSSAYLKRICFQKRTGTSLLDLSDAAETIGLRTVGLKLTWEQLSSQVSLPCVITWNKNHFVVVYKINKSNVIVGDPSQGILKYPIDAFKMCWHSINEPCQMGIAMLFEPTPMFYKNEEHIGYVHKIGMKRLFSYVKPYRIYLLIVGFLILLSSFLSLIFPVLTKATVDIGVGNNNLKFIGLILIAQLILAAGQVSNEILKNWLLLNISIRVNLSLVSDFLGKLMRLPISFFDSKKIGDLTQRIGDFSRIQHFLTSVLISLVTAFVAFIAYSWILLNFSLQILGIFLTGSILYITWTILFLRQRKKLDYMRFQESANNQSNIIQLITGMQEIKLNNCEKKKAWEWQQIQSRLYDVSLKSLNLLQTQQAGGLFIDQTKNIIITFLAAQSVINGEMTLGMMLAVQYIVGQMNAPVSQFISFMQSTQDAKISLDRLNEIQEIEDEGIDKGKHMDEIDDNLPITVKNLNFRYNGPRSRLVLKNISFSIEPHKITAIVGTSGSGKTTLMKILLGFYKPISGEIYVGKNKLTDIEEKAWRKKCGVVMQDGFIFSDTIANNIAASDNVTNIQRVKSAATSARINDFVESLPMGYNTVIGMEGNGISSGQKQRVLIARVVYKNAPYIFLDEATNALDANNEASIMNNLTDFFKGKTVVIIAHRLSTIKKADKIIVMDNGNIVEEGNHAQLISRNGPYSELIKKQMDVYE